MSTIITHLVKENETISSLAKQYNCSIEEIKLLNPNIKNKLYIGKIIYVKNNNFTINNEIIFLSNQTLLLSQKDYISYINKFNDHILIEEDLFILYKELSSILLNEENNQYLLLSYLKQSHTLLHEFIDNLSIQNEENIINCKNKIKENISNIYLLFNNNHINVSLDDITKIIEQRMLIIAKILNNNYYDLYQNIKKECLSIPSKNSY